MADILSLLGMGAVAKTKADSAQLEGQGIRRDREQKDLLARLARERQAEQDAQAAEMFGLQKQNILDLIRERSEAPLPKAETPETFGQPIEAMQGGKKVLVRPGSRGGMAPVTDYEPVPDAPRPVAAAGGSGGGTPRAPRTPTGEQEKSYNWYQMMNEAAPILDQMEEKIRPDMIWAAINTPEMARPALNRLLTTEEQQYYNALRKFGAGQLRKETGAAFGPGELADVFSRYGPTGGNQPEVIQQIRAGRNSALENMKLMATPAQLYYEQVRGGGLPQDDPASAAADASGFPTGSPQAAPRGAPAAATPEQKLWDAAVAKHGKEKVLATFGPRP